MQTFVPRKPSRRSQAVLTACRLFVRPLEHIVPDSPAGIAITRRMLAGLMAAGSVLERGVRVEEVDLRKTPYGRIKGEWNHPAGARTDAVILYIHGSGYNLCSTRTHRPLVTRIAHRTRLPVFSTEYRLAPEHVFPAAADDVERAWQWLRAEGWRADQIIVAGDSAGGHLTLDLALLLLRAGEDLPAGLVMLSPLADLSCELMEHRERAVPDPLISAAGVRRLLAHYLAGEDPKHPRLTHVLAEGEVLPPTLIQAGGAEFLAADAHHLAAMLRTAGSEVTLEVWPGQMHVFQAAPRAVPEADRALDRAARFIGRTLATRAAVANPEQVSA